MSEQRAFRGIWIPRELWLTDKLSLQEKVMLVEIDSLQHPERGCFKSNRKLAEFFQLSPSRVSAIISSLTEKGMVRVEQVREDKRVVERRIYMTASLGDLFGGQDPEGGWSGSSANPGQDPEGGWSGSSEERGSVRGVQKEEVKAKRKTAMPDDFKPNETCRSKAIQLGINLEAELDKFASFHQAKGNKYVDWQAAFRNWLTKAAEFRAQRGSNVSQFTPRTHADDSGSKIYVPTPAKGGAR